MKDKKAFQIISALGVIASLLSLFSCVKLGNEAYVEYSKLLAEMSSTVITKNYFIVMFFILSAVNIFLFGYIFMSAKNEKLAERKGKVVPFSIITILCSVTMYSQLAGVVLLICLLTVKGVKAKKEKYKDIPKLTYKVDRFLPGIKGILLCLLLIALYFAFVVFDIYVPEDMIGAIIYSIVIYGSFIAISVIIFRNELVHGIKKFKENFKTYIHFCFSQYGYYLIFYFFAAIISFSLTKKQAANQEALQALPLWYLIPVALVYAPIVEETIFRGCFRRIFGKSNKLFIIVSGLVFGYLHAMNEVGLLNIFATMLPYATLGCCFAYMYTRSNNITCNMFLHFLHNGMTVILMILMRL